MPVTMRVKIREETGQLMKQVATELQKTKYTNGEWSLEQLSEAVGKPLGRVHQALQYLGYRKVWRLVK